MKAIIIGAIIFGNLMVAQPTIRDYLYHKKPEKVVPGESLELTVTLKQLVPIQSGLIYYRPVQGSSFYEQPMAYIGSGWAGTIPGDRISESGLEYFLVLKLNNGGLISFPSDTPYENPYFCPADLRIQTERGFRGQRPESREKSVEENVLIISPEPESVIPPKDVVIAVSLFYTEDIDTTDIRLLLDHQPLSKGVQYSEGVLTTVIPSLAAGEHSLSLRLTTRHGLPVKPIDWTFRITDEGFHLREEINLRGKVSSRLSTERTSGTTRTITELSGQLSGGLSWVDTKTAFRLTSRENPYQQPYNRFSGTVKFGNYLTINMGDYNPVISPYMIDGRRVRGIGVDVQFPWFRFQVVQGELNRAVQQTDAVDGGYVLQTANIKTDSLGTYIYPLDRTGYTFQRSINLYQLTLQTPRKYRWRLSVLKAKDDMTTVDKQLRSSAQFTVDSSATGLTPGTYTYGQFAEMISTTGGRISFPDKYWSGGDPEDNLVIGTTIQGLFDDQRLSFEFSWNFSLFNRNIWDGAVTRVQMDTTLDDSLDGFIGVNYDENGLVTEGSLFIDTSKVFDPTLYEGIFTINAYMTPLLPFDLSSYEKHPIATIVNMPSSAFHLKLNGNYRHQNFQVEYRQVGPEFVSLGNPYLSTNIREFVASDQISLLERKLHLSVTYKFHDNKILATTVDPLVTHSLVLGLSISPGPDVPSMMVNIQSIGKTNEKKELDIIGDSRQDLREDFRTINSLFSVTFPFEWKGLRQMMTVNYSTILNHDQLKNERGANYVFNKTDTDALSVSLSTRLSPTWRLISNFSRTNLYLPIMNEEGIIIQKPYSWTAIAVNTQNSLQSSRLRFAGGFSYLRSSGDIKSNIFGLKSGAEYDLVTNLVLSASLNLQLSQVPSYRKDNTDNNGNGKTDELFEPWSWTSSGLFLTLKYSF